MKSNETLDTSSSRANAQVFSEQTQGEMGGGGEGEQDGGAILCTALSSRA